jgi:N-acetylneuraminic acid mutarotase
MSVPRGFLVLTIIASVALLGCGGAAGPERSSTRTQRPAEPSALPSPTSGPSSAPAPSQSVAPAAQAGTWLDAGKLHEARNATNVALLTTGQILVVGSDYETSWRFSCGASTNGSDAVEIGDPSTGTWQKATDLPNLRDDPAIAALPDGRALMTGGAAGENIGWSAFSSTYIFDPTTRDWSRSGLMHTARAATAIAVLQDGRVLVAGGLFMDRTSSAQPRVLDSAEIWDPRTGAWSVAGQLAKARTGASAVTLADGRVLVVGGTTRLEGDATGQAAVDIYDPATDRWSAAGALATARTGFVLVALPDGGALIAGGYAEVPDAPFGRLSTVERFDPVSNTWSAAAGLPYPVAGAFGSLLGDGRVLVAGGSVRDAEPLDIDAGTISSGLTSHANLFDPRTDTWAATTEMPSRRAGAELVAMPDGSALVVGGSGSEGPSGTPGCPEAHPQVLRFVLGS